MINGNKCDKIIETWLKDKEMVAKVDLARVNDEGKNITMLFIEYSTPKMFRFYLSHVDAKNCINIKDNDGNTALLLASQMGKWIFAKELLINPGLKIGKIKALFRKIAQIQHWFLRYTQNCNFRPILWSIWQILYENLTS